jgi:hypothetical protein
MTPPAVSKPKDNGVASNKRKSSNFLSLAPPKMADSTAAP